LRSGAIALNAVKATILLAGERFQQVAERYIPGSLARKGARAGILSNAPQDTFGSPG
jgi:ADP-dependent phosphofructokinase/glucokinase